MRKTLALALTVAVVLIGAPVGAFATTSKTPPAGQSVPTGALTGTAMDASQRALPGAHVQVRDRRGALVATGTTNGSGGFSFAGLAPGSYTIEIVSAAGDIVGTSAAVTLLAGATAVVPVTAAAAGAIAAASGGGLSLFGLGTIGTVALVGGAATAAIVGYQVTKGDVSPSR
ncbi:MAG: carboxypeptidase-like regulatory domain-containing protein [Acidobacteriota bacterium]